MKRIVSLVSCMLCLASSLCAQTAQKPADNAALRYWMAFAQMKDAQLANGDLLRMDSLINSGSPWDEQKFGAFVEQNEPAIETMIRGTSLPYCEWGVETNLGPEAPIEYVVKARALARLNTLYGMRLAATGHEDEAVRSVVAGIRFAEHLSENASFLGTLVASVTLTPELKFAAQLGKSGRLSPQDRSSLSNAVRSLPEGAFDWSHAALEEKEAIHIGWANFLHRKDPKAEYAKWFGDSAPKFHVPTEKEMAALDHAWDDYANLLKLAPEQAEAQLPQLKKEIVALDPVLQIGMPDPEHLVAARTKVIKAQQETAEALGIR
jgi:hypothetical protein